ncbi:MAG TPA: hypothetical protein VEK07_17965 [Polyangiaceae bacterium]|nr:hypothetical protein [Polyangiaceae bacterium]
MVRPPRIIAAIALSAVSQPARADEPVGEREPPLMRQAAEITMVASAFDKNDPFDVNVIVGFTESWQRAGIRRETPAAQGSAILGTEDIATYSSTKSGLLAGADIGLYHDLALLLRVPIILSWSQRLDDLDGSAAAAPQRLADPSGGQLFTVPFNSPTRSGVDYVSAGLDWAIFDQERDSTKPTWVIGVEGRLAVGPPLHACNANANPQCPDPSNPSVARGPGISRGMDGLVAKTIWSRRVGYVEPYTGLSVLAEFPQASSEYAKWNPPEDLQRIPPVVGSVALGLEVVPYEQRESFQKVSADFRVKAAYHSPGRDYSELFDALGSSEAASLRTPNPAAYMAGPNNTSVPNDNDQVYFSGITEQQAFGSVTVSASATWQAGEYIKFTLGSALSYEQSHLVTAADPCTPNGNTNAALAGPCVNPQTETPLGVPNPDHRDTIDSPGHRFYVDDAAVVDVWAMGIVMF